jgi:formiminoglutamase
MTIWQGRIDAEEDIAALRWHQKVQRWDRKTKLNHGATLLGFACDEGVRRNQGRVGAREGPGSIRSALANLAYHGNNDAFDAGDVYCDDKNLEQAQTLLAQHLSHILAHGGFPLVLGGGHEMAWGSFQGIVQHLDAGKRLGIINFDAHFDLRNSKPQPSSGTPFRQMADWCQDNGVAFHYGVFGINPTANTSALFHFAEQHNVVWHTDVECSLSNLHSLQASLADFVQRLDYAYLTICLDVFPAGIAPGVSAPGAPGVDPAVVIHLIKAVRRLCMERKVALIMADIAEMNPTYDREGLTSRLAARMVHEILF